MLRSLQLYSIGSSCLPSETTIFSSEESLREILRMQDGVLELFNYEGGLETYLSVLSFTVLFLALHAWIKSQNKISGGHWASPSRFSSRLLIKGGPPIEKFLENVFFPWRNHSSNFCVYDTGILKSYLWLFCLFCLPLQDCMSW